MIVCNKFCAYVCFFQGSSSSSSYSSTAFVLLQDGPRRMCSANSSSSRSRPNGAGGCEHGTVGSFHFMTSQVFKWCQQQQRLRRRLLLLLLEHGFFAVRWIRRHPLTKFEPKHYLGIDWRRECNFQAPHTTDWRPRNSAAAALANCGQTNTNKNLWQSLSASGCAWLAGKQSSLCV